MFVDLPTFAKKDSSLIFSSRPLSKHWNLKARYGRNFTYVFALIIFYFKKNPGEAEQELELHSLTLTGISQIFSQNIWIYV